MISFSKCLYIILSLLTLFTPEYIYIMYSFPHTGVSGKSFVAGFRRCTQWDCWIYLCLCRHKWYISLNIDRKSAHWSRDINNKLKLLSRDGTTTSKLPLPGRLFQIFQRSRKLSWHGMTLPNYATSFSNMHLIYLYFLEKLT